MGERLSRDILKSTLIRGLGLWLLATLFTSFGAAIMSSVSLHACPSDQRRCQHKTSADECRNDGA
jgi:hypothetical protein